MSKLGVIFAHGLTALVTATVTSLFWISAYGNGAREQEASEDGGRSLVREPPSKVAPDDRVPVASGLAIPVVGVKPSELIDTFTQARAGGRPHDAIDIMAPQGTPVVAAAPGSVEKLFFSKGGGGITAYVRSTDGDWSYYYAHLKDYAPGLMEGEAVRRGALIGHVGSTGNANPAGPQLHFAIHRMKPGERWYQGTAVNPYPLLARAAR